MAANSVQDPSVAGRAVGIHGSLLEGGKNDFTPRSWLQGKHSALLMLLTVLRGSPHQSSPELSLKATVTAT